MSRTFNAPPVWSARWRESRNGALNLIVERGDRTAGQANQPIEWPPLTEQIHSSKELSMMLRVALKRGKARSAMPDKPLANGICRSLKQWFLAGEAGDGM